MNALSAVRRITLPLDLADGFDVAFHHALRLAVRNRARLDVLRVEDGSGTPADAPPTGALLAQWGLVEDPGSTDHFVKLGLEVNVRGPVSGDLDLLAPEVDAGDPDLVVAHGNAPMPWEPAPGQHLARLHPAPTLFLSPEQAGWIDPVTGEDRLRTVVVPIGGDVTSVDALLEVFALLPALGEGPFVVHLVHAGDVLDVGTVPSGLVPEPHAMKLHTVEGDVVESVVAAAGRLRADLIAMCTHGVHGVRMDVLGTRTEKVVRQAPCPVLQIPLS